MAGHRGGCCPVAVTIAGIAVEPESSSRHTIPDASEWNVIVNASITRWGHESCHTKPAQAREAGRSTVASGSIDAHVEDFTIEAMGPEGGAGLVLGWERTRVPYRFPRAESPRKGDPANAAAGIELQSLPT